MASYHQMPRTCYHEQLSPSKLAIVDLCEYENLGWIITRINVPAAFRGRGVAHQLLTRVIVDADRHQVTLWLEISPSYGLSYEQLEAWYHRHGFRWYRGTMGMMRRKPACPLTVERQS